MPTATSAACTAVTTRNAGQQSMVHKDNKSLKFCLLGTTFSLEATTSIEDVEVAVRDMLTASVPEGIRAIHANHNRSLTDYNHYAFYRMVQEQQACRRVDIARIHVYHRDDPALQLSVMMALQVVYVVSNADGTLEETALFARGIPHGSSDYVHFGAERSTLELDLDEHLVHITKVLVHEHGAPRPRSQLIFETNRRTVVVGGGATTLTNALPDQGVSTLLDDENSTRNEDRRVVALAGISGQHICHFGYLSMPYSREQHLSPIRRPLMIQYNRQHPRWLNSMHPIADANHYLHRVTPAFGTRFCGLGFYLRLMAQPHCVSVRICRLLCYTSQRQPRKKILSLQVVYESRFVDGSTLETMGPQISCYFAGFQFPPNAHSSHISVHTLNLEHDDDYIVSIRTRQDEQGVNQVKVETSRGQKVAFGKRVGTKQPKHVLTQIENSPAPQDNATSVDLITHPLYSFRLVALVGFCQNKCLVRLGAVSQLVPWPVLKPWILVRHLVQLQRATPLPLKGGADDGNNDSHCFDGPKHPSLAAAGAVGLGARTLFSGTRAPPGSSLLQRLRINKQDKHHADEVKENIDQFYRIVQAMVMDTNQDIFRKVLSFLAPTQAY